MSQQWKSLRGFDFEYRINVHGKVKSFAKDRKGKMMVGSVSKTGEISFTLVENKQPVRMTINQLLFMAYNNITLKQWRRRKRRFYMRKNPNKPYHKNNIVVMESRTDCTEHIWNTSEKMKNRSQTRIYLRMYTPAFVRKVRKEVFNRRKKGEYAALTKVAKKYNMNRSSLDSIYRSINYAHVS